MAPMVRLPIKTLISFFMEYYSYYSLTSLYAKRPRTSDYGTTYGYGWENSELFFPL